MKRKIIVAVCLLLIFSLSVITAFAAGSVNISLKSSKSSVAHGNEITVTVSATVDVCGSGGVEVFYDTAAFEMVSGTWLINPFMKDFSTETNDGTFAFEGKEALSGDVFKFVLRAKKDATLGESSVSVVFKADTMVKTDSLTITIECDHKYDTGEVTKEATCNEEGTRIRTCTRCGEKRTDKIAKLGHQYDAGQVEETPTCTEEGKLVYTCTRCGTTKSEKIDPTGHAYDDDCDSECNNCGESRTVEHNYGDYWTSDASGHWHGCIDCGHVLELFPHNPGPEATETTEQICLDCHYVLQPCKPHEHAAVGDWLGDEEHHWNKCACGENFDEGDHQWNEGDVNESTGEVTYLCTVCGYSKTVAQETVPPTQPEDVGTEPTRPGQQGGEEKEANPWIVVSLILAILLAASWIYIILGIIGGKKRGGKFSS